MKRKRQSHARRHYEQSRPEIGEIAFCSKDDSVPRDASMFDDVAFCANSTSLPFSSTTAGLIENEDVSNVFLRQVLQLDCEIIEPSHLVFPTDAPIFIKPMIERI
jgi:hypothetical protein